MTDNNVTYHQLTASDRSQKRLVQFNVLLASLVTVAAWVTTIAYVFQHGSTWWLFYFAIGTIHGMIHITTKPFYYVKGSRPAYSSLLFYLKMVTVWLPLYVYTAFEALYSILTWGDEDFRGQRMLERLEDDVDRGYSLEDEFPED